MERGISTRLTTAEGRKFGYTIGAAFVVFAAIGWWRGHAVSWKVFATLGGAFLIAGTILPTRLGWVQRGWMAAAHFLSTFTTPIFMGVVYFFVITPIALFTRAIGRNTMKHAENNGGYWISAPSGGRSSLEHQY